MNDVTPEPRSCEVCGGRINQDNKYGVCQRSAECRKIRARRKNGRTESRYCEACGRRLNSNNRSGVCAAPTPECAEARKRKRRKVNPKRKPPQRIVVNAGDVFGRLTVLDEYNPARKFILCRCECGTEKRLRRSHLAGEWVRSCGCLRYENRAQNKALYLTAGTVFGHLAVIKDVASCNDYATFACDCGGEVTTKAVQVKLGLTKSCGCLTRTLGGFSKHPLYSTWASMVQRCTNPNHQGYRNYGGRASVTVCERWRDPWLFAEDIYREIGHRPEDRNENGRVLYELDRINNDYGYWCGRCADCASKGQATINVRWSDKKTQRANQRTVGELTRERDALAAELATLKASLE